MFHKAQKPGADPTRLAEDGAARSRPLSGLWRASLILLVGGATAQALPLLLGPLLTRLFTVTDFGTFHLFSAVAANIGVVACARYEYALPPTADDSEANALRVLCLRLLAGATLASGVGAAAWWARGAAAWVAWLPLAVAAAGAASLATLWAARAQRFSALASARVLQYGGGAAGQVAAGLAGTGVTGLIVAPILASLFVPIWLRLPLSFRAPRPGALVEVARRHRAFPLLNSPHAFVGAFQDTLCLVLIAANLGPAAAGFWGLSLRYLKAPATLVGSAVSQALYPKLAAAGPIPDAAGRVAVRLVMAGLALLALPLVLLLWLLGPWLFAKLFGSAWREAGELARALALYIGLHFVASPLSVVTMCWEAQAWALKLALVGQVVFLAALAAGLYWDGLAGAGWSVSFAMLCYFGYFFASLAFWPVATPTPSPTKIHGRESGP